MIKLKVKKNIKENSIKAFTVSGHAGFAKKAGELDIVCAAVSGIVYAALGYMEEYYSMKDFKEADGYIRWEKPENISEEAERNINPVVDAMVVGIKQIEAAYGKYVKVEIEEV